MGAPAPGYPKLILYYAYPLLTALLHYLADDPRLGDGSQELIDIGRSANHQHAHTHVEHPVHLLFFYTPPLLNQGEYCGSFPRTLIDLRRQPSGEDAGQVARYAPSCDMRHPLNHG